MLLSKSIPIRRESQSKKIFQMDKTIKWHRLTKQTINISERGESTRLDGNIESKSSNNTYLKNSQSEKL